jgi:hypothetical protein
LLLLLLLLFRITNAYIHGCDLAKPQGLKHRETEGQITDPIPESVAVQKNGQYSSFHQRRKEFKTKLKHRRPAPQE